MLVNSLFCSLTSFLIALFYTSLTPSPPLAPLSISTIDDGPHARQDNHGAAIKPLGVDVPRRRNDGLGRSMIVVIVLSSITAFVICLGIVWLLLLKCGPHVHQPGDTPQTLISSTAKLTG